MGGKFPVFAFSVNGSLADPMNQNTLVASFERAPILEIGNAQQRFCAKTTNVQGLKFNQNAEYHS
jgi:hypothetical protein